MEYSSSEVIQIGKCLYASAIAPIVEREHQGELLAVDVDSGDYATGRDSITASQLLRRKKPNATIFMIRIGFPTAVRVGGSRS